MNNKNFLKKYKRCIYEYTNMAGAFDLSEDENEMDMPQDNSAQQNNGDMMPQQDGEEQMPIGDEGGEMEMPMNAEVGDEQMSMGNGVEGFNPEGGDMEGMNSNDEVIDVDDLTKSQENVEKKIDIMNSKFEKLMGAVETLIKQNAQRDKEIADMEKRAIEQQEKFTAELDKRIPTPQQRMTMRSTKSAPYSMTPNEYMNNYAPENYSSEDDNNGVDDMQYQITKDDIDNFRDFSTVAKELDIEHQGLNDILDLR